MPALLGVVLLSRSHRLNHYSWLWYTTKLTNASWPYFQHKAKAKYIIKALETTRTKNCPFRKKKTPLHPNLRSVILRGSTHLWSTLLPTKVMHTTTMAGMKEPQHARKNTNFWYFPKGPRTSLISSKSIVFFLAGSWLLASSMAAGFISRGEDITVGHFMLLRHTFLIVFLVRWSFYEWWNKRERNVNIQIQRLSWHRNEGSLKMPDWIASIIWAFKWQKLPTQWKCRLVRKNKFSRVIFHGMLIPCKINLHQQKS